MQTDYFEDKIKMKMNELIKTKTFWGGIVGVVSGSAGYFTGAMSPAESIQTILGGLVAIFLRDGMLKVGR